MSQSRRVVLVVLLGGLAAGLAVYGATAYPGRLAFWLGIATLVNLAVGLGTLYRNGDRLDWVAVAEILFLGAAGWLAVLHTGQAAGLYSLQRPDLDRAVGYAPVLILIHFGFLNYALFRRQRVGLRLLQGAVLCTGLLYLPAFETPEAGLPFMLPVVFTLIVLAAAFLAGYRWRTNRREKWLLATLGGLWLACAAATLASFAPGESLEWMFKWTSLALLMLAVPLLAPDRAEWKLLFVFALISSLLPVLVLGILKMAQIVWVFGLPAGLTYRLNVLELGRANLIARELMIAFPLLIGLRGVQTQRRLRLALLVCAGLALALFGLTQSMGGLVGAALMLAFTVWLTRRDHLSAFFSGRRKGLWTAGAGLLLVIGLAGAGLVASRLNVGSFNGRLFQFRAALAQIAEHPLLGVGPGVYHVKAQVAANIEWLVDNRLSRDNPLLPVQWYQDSTRLHSHNLFLEMGVGMGLPGLVVFIGFLGLLFTRGIQIRGRMTGPDRRLLDGALVGLSAAVGWGVLDVVQAAPPFFATSIWMLAGLVLASGRLLVETPEKDEKARILNKKWLAAAGVPALTLLAVFVIFLAGNGPYRKAYKALVAQEWKTAAQALEQAARWEPFNPFLEQLLGETLINLGQFDQARDAYSRATVLKRDFGPYLQQLGWLDWLLGDPAQAEAEFKAATAVDPNGAWQNDAYSALGLLYAASGREDLAVQALARELALDPNTAALPHWCKVLNPDGHIEVLLDPAYLQLENPGTETRMRILERLGQADVTSQRFTPPRYSGGSIAITQVFSELERQAGDPQTAPRVRLQLLASLTQAAHAAGLEEIAAVFASQFLDAAPGSTFGALSLAEIDLQQGALEQAQGWVAQAAEVNAHSPDVLKLAARTALLSGDQAASGVALEPLQVSAPFDLEAARLLLESTDRNLLPFYRRAALLDTSIASRLELVDELTRSGDPSGARAECRRVLRTALLRNPPVMSAEVTRLGVCLAQTAPENFQQWLTAEAGLNPRLADWVEVQAWNSLGETVQAVETARALQASYPLQWNAAVLLAQQQAAGGDPAGAEQSLLLAAELDQGQPLPWEELGRLYVAQGNSTAAIQAFQNAVQRAPGRPETWLGLAKATFESDQKDLASSAMTGLKNALGIVEDGERLSLFTDLPAAELGVPGPGYILPDLFAMPPQPLPTIFMHPDSQAVFQLDLPVVESEERLLLRTFVGMSSASWSQEGDGVTFRIRVGEGELETGLSLNPKANPQERSWQPLEVDLTAWAGKTVRLELATTTGPAGDNRFDWAGWGNPRIVVVSGP